MKKVLHALLLCACAALAPARSAPLPLSAFFDNPAMQSAKLSPDGRHVAFSMAKPMGRVYLVTIDVESGEMKLAAAYADSDVAYFQWISDQRLVYTLTDLNRAAGELFFWPGLFATNYDGSQPTKLIRQGRYDYNFNQLSNLPVESYLAGQWGAQNSEFVYVQVNGDLMHLNTLTGKAIKTDRPRNNDGWLVDRKGVPRIAFASKANQQSIYYREHDGQPWQQVARQDIYSVDNLFQPRFFGPAGDLYVTAGLNGADALFRYDLTKQERSEIPIISTPGYDFEGEMIADDQKILGFTYEVDAHGTYWVDERMQAVQKAVDATLPGTNNMIAVARRSQNDTVLVTSNSDVQPPVFSLYNTKTAQLKILGRSRPAILADQMSHKIMVRYKARDGLEIPAYLTTPKASDGKNLPMVVLVHGGPWMRGVSWDWDAESQFLASRGYAVLEPEYRGSTGYGLKHFMAGWKQWGLKMQDDIADGTRWAIAQGYANPKRICIAGASYGGYATLMGLINDPDLYQCGISWSGITDIPMWNKGHWSGQSDLDDVYKQYGFPVLMGDLEKDATQFKATSPLQQAARVTQPLLLAHGEVDQRVPMIHGSLFYDAVRKTNPNVEWVWYEEEGHGWRLVKNRLDFWRRVERFLEKNIGKP
ncbi:prolyl oligopeptidase family serine peptidase [Duganella sp. CY15W]|uniref:alpha/beta hydrolase family protein n=1 Tax=Duganella sp. CY15W TaxID=2692172 RepID=UPI00136C9BE6|nr:alpha/beta fold hydrolase [Duganella sp. CY15W]MYM29864.1 prolyl oligopeptidase family serine peptidase [Duganella sp. CY15W]